MKKSHANAMNKTIVLLFAALFILSGGLSVSIAQENQEKSQEEHGKIVEEVDVTNVEVPVRVMYRGTPVTDLTIDDFTLYEDKKKMAINGFFLKRKTLNIPGSRDQAVQAAPLRTFVLVFNVTETNPSLEKAVNHLFESVLLPTDRLMIFVNDKTLEYKDLNDIAAIKTRIMEDITVESVKARRRLITYIRRVETLLNVNDFRIELFRRDADRPRRAIDFLKRLVLTWTEYQKRFLVPRVERFYYFSRYLEKLKGEKWVLNFYQFEFFPRIRPNSETMDTLRDMTTRLINSGVPTSVSQGRMILSLITKLNNSLSVGKYFPNEEITRLFYKVDATFHGFFIRSTNATVAQDIDYQTVSSDLETVLKGISDITGGENITSGNLVQSIDTIRKREDAYYMLTYVPRNPEKAGRIKIKLNSKKYKAIYDDNIRADYINAYFNKLETKLSGPAIKIENFSFKRKILAFSVRNFLMRKVEGKPIGHMHVRIRLLDKGNNALFDQAKTLVAQKDVMKVSIPAFKTIKKGKYDFLIDARDMMTGKEDKFQKNVVVKR